VLLGPAYKAGLAQHLPAKARETEGIPAGRDLREAYFLYAAMTRDAAQRRSWTFYEAINILFII
jgi:hypothetical protein